MISFLTRRWRQTVHVTLSSLKALMSAALVSSAIEVSHDEGIELIANFDIAPEAEIVLKKQFHIGSSE